MVVGADDIVSAAGEGEASVPFQGPHPLAFPSKKPPALHDMEMSHTLPHPSSLIPPRPSRSPRKNLQCGDMPDSSKHTSAPEPSRCAFPRSWATVPHSPGSFPRLCVMGCICLWGRPFRGGFRPASAAASRASRIGRAAGIWTKATSSPTTLPLQPQSQVTPSLSNPFLTK